MRCDGLVMRLPFHMANYTRHLGFERLERKKKVPTSLD